MIRCGDGRRVGVRRNGAFYVSVLDDRRQHFVIDNRKAGLLADALEKIEPVRVGTNHGQVLAVEVVQPVLSSVGATPELGAAVVILGDANTEAPAGRPQQPTFRSCWELSTDQCRRLAEEIRQVVSG